MINVTLVTHHLDKKSYSQFQELIKRSNLSKVRLVVWLCETAFRKAPQTKQLRYVFFDVKFKENLLRYGNFKLLLLLRAAELNFFNTEHFIWVDQGLLKTLLRTQQIDNCARALDYLSEGKKFIYSRRKAFGGDINLLNVISGKVAAIPVAQPEKSFWEAISLHLRISGYETHHIDSGSLISQLKQIGSTGNFYVNKSKYLNRNPFFSLKITLYVISFNAPIQFQKLIASIKKIDKSFLLYSKKILLNNSTIDSFREDYDKLCRENDFIQIKKFNLGISGGRQFIADHFDKSGHDYYICFEDDMLLHDGTIELCKMGLPTRIPNLFLNSLRIIHRHDLDFLKLSFSEEYSDNSIQWTWYVLTPQERLAAFPKFIPRSKLDAPKVIFSAIKRFNKSASFAVGNVYYSNWPMWMSASGNKKIFIENAIGVADERNWMRKVFYLHQKLLINAGVLLSSTINHQRIISYPGERKENRG